MTFVTFLLVVYPDVDTVLTYLPCSGLMKRTEIL